MREAWTRRARSSEVGHAFELLDELRLEDAVDPDRVAKDRRGLDAVPVHVVEPIEPALDRNPAREIGAREEERLVAPGTDGDRVTDLAVRIGDGVTVERRVIVRLEAEDDAAADLAKRKLANEVDRVRKEGQCLVAECFSRSGVFVFPPDVLE